MSRPQQEDIHMKLSKRVLAIVEERQHAAEWCAKIAARIDDKDPSLPDHFTREYQTSEYYAGLRDGHQSAVECLLMAHKAYNGFRFRVCSDHGAEWYEYDLSRAK